VVTGKAYGHKNAVWILPGATALGRYMLDGMRQNTSVILPVDDILTLIRTLNGASSVV